MLENWLAARKHKKKINDLQKAIDKLHKSFEMSTKHEKYYLEEAAKNLEDARALEYYCQKPKMKKYTAGRITNRNLCKFFAMHFDILRERALEELVLVESLKKREIEALHHLTTAQE